MGIVRTGDWNKVGNIVSNLSKIAVESRDIALKNFALKGEAVAKQHISNQDLGWVPLKVETINQKVKKGLSTNILISTSTYFQSITSKVVNKTAYAGVVRGVMSGDGKTQLVDIAPVHEFGSSSARIPARPLWKPTLQECLEWSVKNNNPAKIFMDKLKRLV